MLATIILLSRFKLDKDQRKFVQNLNKKASDQTLEKRFKDNCLRPYFRGRYLTSYKAATKVYPLLVKHSWKLAVVINRDFKIYPPNKRPRINVRTENFKLYLAELRQAMFGLVTGLCIIVFATLFFKASRLGLTDNDAFKSRGSVPLHLPTVNLSETPVTEADSDQVAVSDETNEPKESLLSIEVKKGDNLSRIFTRAGFSQQTLANILALPGVKSKLTRVHPGEVFSFRKNGNNDLLELQYIINPVDTLVIHQKDSRFRAEVVSNEMELRLAYGAATIETSLYGAKEEAGLNNRLIVKLSEIFQWDIDFIMDVRQGDRFSVLYEEQYIEGKKIGLGDIVAASFTNQGKTYTAVRYENKEGKTAYYSPEGRSMHKAFLRAPLSFSRVSANFSYKRKHPILNRIRSHLGIDYAAPTGTPVRASGDGKIKFLGRNGGFGKLVVINHGKKYQSKYAHLSRFARGLKKGSKVKQGQIIGYVGSTGLATGPHLHYEFLVNGRHKNPKTVKLPHAKPINKTELAYFRANTQAHVKHLAVKDRVYFAQLASLDLESNAYQ